MPDVLSTDKIAKLVDAAAEILTDSGAKFPAGNNAMLAECRENPHPRFKISPEFRGHFEVNP